MDLLSHEVPASSLSIGLSSSEHLSVRYIDACICEDLHRSSFLYRRTFFFGLGGKGRGVVGKVLQLAVWPVTKDATIVNIYPLDHFFYLFPYLSSTEVKAPLRGLSERSMHNISVNILV